MRIIELFAGIGSQTQALKNLRIEHSVAAISEIDRFAITSYEALHGATNNMGDITKIEKLPAADLWTYSFPCQDLSLAGKQAGLKEGTRSGLLFEVERLLRVAEQDGMLPKYLLLENVKPLAGKFKPEFDKWLEFLQGLDYTNYWQVLNTRDYCIPQNRERVFCISIRGDHKPFIFPEKRELRLRLKDMLDTEVEEKFYLSDKALSVILNATFDKEKRRIQNADSVHRTLCERDFKSPTCIVAGQLGGKYEKMHDISRRVYDADGIAPTVHCAGGGNTEPKIIDPQGRKTKCQTKGLKAHSICPTLRAEIHGNPPQVIIDDTYKGRDPRVYGETAPTLRSDRSGLKVAKTICLNYYKDDGEKRPLQNRIYDSEGIATAVTTGFMPNVTEVVAGQFQPVNRNYKNDGEVRAEYFECRKDELANAILTGDKKNCVVTMLTPNNWGHKAGDGIATRKRSESNICPALQAHPGTSQQSYVKIAAMRGRHDKDGEYAQRLEPNSEGTTNALTSVQKDNLVIEGDSFVGRGYKAFADKNGYVPEMFNPYNQAEIKDEAPTVTTGCGHATSSASVLKTEFDSVRIRKLTPFECLRLQGWRDIEIDKIRAAGVSNSQMYRQAGNGITVTVLMAIFGELLGVEYKELLDNWNYKMEAK